jgi:hypothetical protein
VVVSAARQNDLLFEAASLTTFNILFKNKDEQFRADRVDRPTG